MGRRRSLSPLTHAHTSASYPASPLCNQKRERSSREEIHISSLRFLFCFKGIATGNMVQGEGEGERGGTGKRDEIRRGCKC